MQRWTNPQSRSASHLDYLESFEIVEGTATIVLDGRTISAGPGERVEIPVGVPHRNPY